MSRPSQNQPTHRAGRPVPSSSPDMNKKLTWLLAAVIGFDFGITLLGQPSAYWHDPHTASEGNPAFAWFMVRGVPCYAAFIAAYVTCALVLVRSLPRRMAMTTGLVFLLAHYFAGSTWLSYHFNMGMGGPILYAVVLSTVLISILRPGPANGCAPESAERGPQ